MLIIRYIKSRELKETRKLKNNWKTQEAAIVSQKNEYVQKYDIMFTVTLYRLVQFALNYDRITKTE